MSLATSPPSSAMARRILGEHPRSDIRAATEELSASTTSLPADDGMRLLRHKIQQIRDMAASSEDKARRLHELMTERYLANNPGLARAQSPASMLSGERPFTPASPIPFASSDMLARSPTSMTNDLDPLNPFNVDEQDLVPCYRPPRSRRPSIDYEDYPHDVDGDEPSKPELGCRHYKRNVKIQCFDCRNWYPCRHCHDENELHHLQRRKTENMLCMLCNTAQPAAEKCRHCDVVAAYHYCDICKLWDDDSSKRIYHCTECGICRRGEGIGKDFVHCKKCNICIAIASATSHRCIERAAECDCPICGDYMFTSSASIVAMPCGHYLHRACYTQYMTTAYKCPICKRSAVNMELQWRKLEHAIESQPMPDQLQDTRVAVQCNDCNQKTTVRYHWLGNRCGLCDSFNTNELQLLGPTPIESTQAQEREIDNITQMRQQTRPRFPWTRSVTLPASNADLPQRAGTRARPSPGPYFLSVQDSTVDDDPERRGTATGLESIAQSIPFSPLEVFHRVSRSLSPLGNYFNTLDSAEGSEDDAEFWGSDGQIPSDYEDDSDEDEAASNSTGPRGRELNGSSDTNEDIQGNHHRSGLDDLDNLTGHR